MRNARSEAMYSAIRQAFLSQGYDNLTMGQLATACGLTRRALYHHFSSKEEAFRAQLAWRQMKEVDNTVAAASRVLAQGGRAIDAIVEAIDACYGQTERELRSFAKGAEYNGQVARCCADLVDEASREFQTRLGHLLHELEERGELGIRCNSDAAFVAELLTRAVLGISRATPQYPAEQLSLRYRHMCEAVLFGCASQPNSVESGAAAATRVAAE
jgi:AcrR family transcriptional regulator